LLLIHVGLLASAWSSSESVHEGLKLLLHLLELLLLLLCLLLLLLLECVESLLPVGYLLSTNGSLRLSVCINIVGHLVDELLESITQLLISSTWSSTFGEVKSEQFDDKGLTWTEIKGL
jgi:hypothetical protein